MKTRCPACERYIGTQDECPYCGCDALTPLIVKRLRLGAVCLAVLGILCLGVMSYTHELPLVRVGRVTPMMNFAKVRVRGIVENDAYVVRKEDGVDYMSFYLDDGTGTIRVAAYSEAAGMIAKAGRLPKKNDGVEVGGKLKIDPRKGVTMLLSGPDVTWQY